MSYYYTRKIPVIEGMQIFICKLLTNSSSDLYDKVGFIAYTLPKTGNIVFISTRQVMEYS